MAQSSSDAQFVRQAFDAFEGRLLQYAQHLVGSDEAARDIVQETFMQLCQSPPRAVELDGQLAKWLFTVCRNRAMDVRRKAVRTMSTTQTPAALDRPAAAELSPVALAQRVEQSQQVAELIAALPESQQEVLRLKFQQGLSYKEIAAVTGRTVSHVGVLLHNALKSLRERADE